MPLDYAKFEGLGETPSGSEEEEDCRDPFVGGARGGAELLRAFIAIRDRRLEVDRRLEELLAQAKASCDVAYVAPVRATALEELAREYDDISERILALDGVREEAKLRSFGHRQEIARARMGSSKALRIAGELEAAELRADRALDALRTGLPDASELRREGVAAEQEAAGRRLLRDVLAEAYVCRGEARLLRGSYAAAREDGLVAHAAAKEKGDKQQLEAGQGLALKGEMALHGGAPGPDGKGTALLPEDVADLEVMSSVTEGMVAHAEEGEEEEEDSEEERGALTLNAMD